MGDTRGTVYDERHAGRAAHDGRRVPRRCRTTGGRTELVEGEVIVHEPACLHQFVLAGPAQRALRRLGEVDSRVAGACRCRSTSSSTSATSSGPTSCGTPRDARPARHDRRPYPIPDLAVEVRSPSTWRYDIGAKKCSPTSAPASRSCGSSTRPRARCSIFRRSSARAARRSTSRSSSPPADELTSPQLPGFALALSSLFAD